MRLRRFALTRYGKFTDGLIDFGPAVTGEPDLHIVYGPNEAGKSTALAGFLDLLFGIEMQSRYNFLHPYETMRIGGCLELSTGSRELVRTKGRQQTLRDAGNQPVLESLILGDLGGLDRNAYRTMFSLDDDTLEAGGNSILASNGELGQLLFSASAGLAELSRMLLDIRTTANGFTFPNARSGELYQLKTGLADLKQKREAIDTLASEYIRLASERDHATMHYDAALAEQSAVQAALTRVGRLLAALPRLAALWRHQTGLAGFVKLPEVPASWMDDLPGLEQAESRHRSATELAEAEVRRLSADLTGIAVDAAALGLAGGLDQLTTLAARHRTAEIDLPLRRREVALADGTIAGILVRLDRAQEAEPSRLQLTVVQSAALDGLMESRSGIEAKLASAAEELSQAELASAEAGQALQGEPLAASPAALAAIASALQAWRDSDHPHRLREGAKALLQHRDALTTRLQALAPWSGAAEALTALTMPEPAMVSAWQDDAGEDAALVARRRGELEQLESDLALRQAELDSIGSIAGLLSDQQAAEVRTSREAAWAIHRRALDGATADIFEAALRQDDIAGAARLGHERDLAKLRETAQAVAIKQTQVARARNLLAEAVATQAQHASLVETAAARIDPDLSGFTPARLLTWISTRDDALATWQQLRQAERDVVEAEADATALRGRLLAALAHAAVAFDPAAATEVLLGAAQASLDRETRLQALRQAVADGERVVRRREAAAQKGAQADAAWQGAWREACRTCWLGEAVAALPFGAVRGILAAAAELVPALKERAGLDVRIRGMEDDQAAFARELERLTTALGIASAGQTPIELEKTICDRVQEASRANAARTKLRDALGKAEESQRIALAAAQAYASQVKAMMEALQAASLIEVAGKLRDVQEKAALKKLAAEAEADILSTLHVENLAEASALLDGQAVDSLELEKASLATQHKDLEGRTRELFARKKEAADAIDRIGGDDAVARIEERRQTQLLEIEDKAKQYLRLRLGIAAAERALRAYRDQHRSSMMAEASEAFRLITRGAYRGLSTQPGKDGDVLVAMAVDGGSKLAADLSKGTRFALYLALRAAGYREFAKLRPPVPFIADDVLETFDDIRAEETLRMLGEMSRLGQVIYLTHHDHLIAIAQRTVPGARVHHLANVVGGIS